MLLNCVMAAVLLISAANFWFMRRSEQVYAARMELIKQISALSLQDAIYGGGGMWRFRRYSEGPSYNRMLYTFWKPVNSFFPPAAQWEAPTEVAVANIFARLSTAQSPVAKGH